VQVPIDLVAPLRPEQRVSRVCGLREVPLDPGVRAEADKEDALAPLGNAIICRVQNPHHHPIAQALLCPLGVLVLEAREVGQPFFVPLGNEIGIGQLQTDVFEVVRKAAAREPLHVFEDERSRSELAHGADRLREHVPAIEERPVASAHRERLAGRSARHQVNGAVHRAEIELSNVALVDRPVRDRIEATFLVLAKGIAGPAVPVHDGGRSEARLAYADPKASSAYEEFDRSHHPRNSPIRVCNSSRFFVWHSQITRTSHPSSASRTRLRSSRSLFVSNFGPQKSSFDLGSLASLHPGSRCWCQKQPCTKITFMRDGKTKSGDPGSPSRCSR